MVMMMMMMSEDNNIMYACRYFELGDSSSGSGTVGRWTTCNVSLRIRPFLETVPKLKGSSERKGS